MILVNQMLQELTDYSEEWNNGEITKEELNIKIDLLLERLEWISINYDEAPLSMLDTRIQASFNHLLWRAKYKATQSLMVLKNTPNKASYNAKLRHLLKRKMYFNQLHRTLQNNVKMYIDRNRLRNAKPDMQIFIMKGTEGNE